MREGGGVQVVTKSILVLSMVWVFKISLFIFHTRSNWSGAGYLSSLQSYHSKFGMWTNYFWTQNHFQVTYITFLFFLGVRQFEAKCALTP